jgi:hypothetical protein
MEKTEENITYETEKRTKCEECGKECVLAKWPKILNHKNPEIRKLSPCVRHHISYKPDIIKILCMDCHMKQHKFTQITIDTELKNKLEELKEDMSFNKYIKCLINMKIPDKTTDSFNYEKIRAIIKEEIDNAKTY